MLQDEISGIWGVFRFTVPATEEPVLRAFFEEAQGRRVQPRLAESN
jgi:hypothetical protein